LVETHRLTRRALAARGLGETGERFGVEVALRDWAGVEASLTSDLIVSTVPAGAADSLAAYVPARPGLLFDVVYAPWPTPLAAAWASAGGKVVGGLELLVAQAAEQVRLMTGKEPPVDRMRAAGEAALRAQ